jgi:hypothetical protein
MALWRPDRLHEPGTRVAAAALLLAVGCGGLGISPSELGTVSNDPSPTNGSDAGVSGGGDGDGATVKGRDAGVAAVDAPTAPATYQGSPLCMASGTTCDPDKPACFYDVDSGSKSDAGAPLCESDKVCTVDAGVPVQVAACRVGAMSTPTCSSNFNQGNVEGAACTGSNDCAIGYDCVGATDATSGTCKHYCCDPSACGTGKASAGPAPFCDIEAVVKTGQLIPVCTTEPSCSPLSGLAGCSSPDETCTIVNSETGQTACVTVGPGMAGSECVDQKCAANLACIGGTCSQLCGTDDNCPTGQTCKYPSAFGAATVGLCSY